MKYLIGLAFLATHACSFAAAPATKPNVLIILSDDLGYGDIGVQGQKEVATPNIDSIAKYGVRFTDGYVSGTMCSPTRAGLMTGRYQTRIVFLSITADYRLKSRHGTTPLECIEDATSATRYVRAHAKELGVDPDRIVASGGSAGGHIAACAVIEGGPQARTCPSAPTLSKPLHGAICVHAIGFTKSQPEESANKQTGNEQMTGIH